MKLADISMYHFNPSPRNQTLINWSMYIEI